MARQPATASSETNHRLDRMERELAELRGQVAASAELRAELADLRAEVDGLRRELGG